MMKPEGDLSTIRAIEAEMRGDRFPARTGDLTAIGILLVLASAVAVVLALRGVLFALAGV